MADTNPSELGHASDIIEEVGRSETGEAGTVGLGSGFSGFGTTLAGGLDRIGL